MNPDDIVRLSVDCRAYLAVITGVRSKVHIKFLTQVPTIDGSRKRSRCLPKNAFQPYDKCGIAWVATAASAPKRK